MGSASMNDYFECQCCSKEHVFCVTSELSNDNSPPELYFHFQLIQYRKFFKRVWIAIKYIFGYQCRYGHWDTINIGEDDTNRLIVLLHQHRVRLDKFSKESTKSSQVDTSTSVS